MLRAHGPVNVAVLPRSRHAAVTTRPYSPPWSAQPPARAGEGEDFVKRGRTRLSVAMMAMAGVLVPATAARADDTVKAKIPFAFVVNGVELPAGNDVLDRESV